MKLNVAVRVPATYSRQVMHDIIADLQTQLNLLSEGALVAKNNAQSSAPTTGTYAVGDFVANSSVSELGSAGSKYLLLGWVVITSSPLAFNEVRTLTGN